MKRGQGRPQRLGDQMQRELSGLLQRELRDPRVAMITITAVDVSPDFSHAKVLFTLFEKDTAGSRTGTGHTAMSRCAAAQPQRICLRQASPDSRRHS